MPRYVRSPAEEEKASGSKYMAEEARFELALAHHQDGFQDRSLKPLGHPSATSPCKAVCMYEYLLYGKSLVFAIPVIDFSLTPMNNDWENGIIVP